MFQTTEDKQLSGLKKEKLSTHKVNRAFCEHSRIGDVENYKEENTKTLRDEQFGLRKGKEYAMGKELKMEYFIDDFKGYRSGLEE